MHAAWLAFLTPGAPSTPSCASSSRCSPASRRCTPSAWPHAAVPAPREPDPLVFYETSSYGPARDSRASTERSSAPEQLLYGSDRPVVEPARAAACPTGSTGTLLARRHASRAAGRRAVLADEPDSLRRVARTEMARPSTAASPAPARARPVRRPSCEAFVAELADAAGAVDRSRPARLTPSASTRSCFRRRASDRVADLLDGRPRHRLSRPRRLRGRGRGRRQGACARSAWRSTARRAIAYSAPAQSFHFSAADIHRVRHAGVGSRRHAARLLAAAVAHGRLRRRRGRRARAPLRAPRRSSAR